MSVTTDPAVPGTPGVLGTGPDANVLKHPYFSTAIPTIPAGLATDLRPNLNAYIGSVEQKAAWAAAFLEMALSALGNGAVSGGNITAGGALNVNVAALNAIVNTPVSFDASQVVGGLVNGTNWIYLRQDATWKVNATGVDPDPTDGHGAFLLWGKATAAAGVVTLVDNTRAWAFGAFQHRPPGPLLFNNVAPAFGRAVIGGGDANYTLLPAEYSCRTLEITGAWAAARDRVLPLTDGAEWVLVNKTSGGFGVNVKGATGTGETVAAGKTAVLRCDGVNIVRVTADAS